MRKIFTLVAAILLAVTVWAQSGCPQKISYQAVVRNAANELVTNTTGITVEIMISDGTISYSETHTVSSNQNGLISFMIGQDGTDIQGTMDNLDWANANMTTTVTVPDELPVVSTTEVVAVPYALYACEINPDGVNITKIKTDIYNHIQDTLSNYYTKAETDNKFLTIDGLCDSIKDCAAIKTIEGNITTINGDITTIEGNISTIQGDITTIEGNITNIKKDYLTIDGLCDSIKNSCSGVALRGEDNTFTDKNTFTDTVYVNNGAVKADGSIATTDSLRAVNAKDLVIYTSNAIHDSITNNVSTMLSDSLENYLTIDGLCDSIKNCEVIKTIEGDITTVEGSITTIEGDVTTISGKVSTIEGDITNIKKDYLTIDGLCDSIENCANVALRNADNTFSDKNTFTDTVYVNNGAVKADGSIATTDSLRAVNAKDLVIYTSNAIHDSITNNVSTMLSDSLENYLTIDGLCDSIKNCEVIKTIEGDITNINGDITTIEGNISTIQGDITTIEGDITTIKKDYLTIDGLCDSIKKCPVITTIEGDITNINGDITTIEGNISTIQGDITTIEGDITTIKKDYLTIDGLCDSIKKCEVITALQTDTVKMLKDLIKAFSGDLTNYYTKSETDNKFLTIDGLCDSIENCANVALRNADNTFSDKNTFTDTVYVNNGAVKADGSIATTDSLRAVNAADLVNYTNNFLTIDGLCDSIKDCAVIKTIEGDITTIEGEITTIEGDVTTISGKVSTIEGDITNIKKDYLTIDGLCDSIENCANVALRNADNTFSDKNTFTDTVYVNKGAVQADGTIATTDSLRAVNAKDLVIYTGNAIHDSITNNVSSMLSDSLNNYLTIGGLCDSIKNNCGEIATKTDVENAVDTLVSESTLNNYYTKSETYSQSEINTKFDGYYTKTKINDTLKDYLTINGLCDSIKNNCGDFATKTDVENAVDTLVSESTLNNYYTKSETYSQSEINTKFDGYYTKTKINDTLKDYLTINGLCDSIKNNCGDFATKTDVENAVDTLVSESTLNNYYTKSETYSQSEINTKFENYYTKTKINDTLANYAVISKEQALTIKSITQADSTKLLNDTTLTIPTGFTLDADHLVKLYINGVYVGDNTDGVLVVTDKKVKYVPAENGDYKLVVGDRIKIIYWVKKN